MKPHRVRARGPAGLKSSGPDLTVSTGSRTGTPRAHDCEKRQRPRGPRTAPRIAKIQRVPGRNWLSNWLSNLTPSGRLGSFAIRGLVAQGIEQRFPKPRGEVRVLPGPPQFRIRFRVRPAASLGARLTLTSISTSIVCPETQVPSRSQSTFGPPTAYCGLQPIAGYSQRLSGRASSCQSIWTLEHSLK